jgi:hypothetical protein
MTTRKPALLSKARRKTSRIRPHEITAPDAKVVILVAANVLAGVFGFFESLENGALAGDAARKEIRKGKARARALAKAETEADPEPDDA